MKATKKPIFVVQEHHARKLHYDFRIEMGGVLKSWAVPKILPTNEKSKSLAVEVEDHPLSFADFEGIIPKGSYGAGTIKIWDKGEYELVNKTDDKINFILHGKKMRGSYCLLRFKRENKKDLWLIFKTK